MQVSRSPGIRAGGESDGHPNQGTQGQINCFKQNVLCKGSQVTLLYVRTVTESRSNNGCS